MNNLLIISATNDNNLELSNKLHSFLEELGQPSTVVSLEDYKFPLFGSGQDADKASINKLVSQFLDVKGFIVCAPEYNGSIPPILTNAIAWLSVQGTDFRSLFNERPIAIASFSGGGCMELLLSMRIQLTHLGALVLGRQLATNKSKIAEDKSINAILNQLLQLNHIN